MSRSYRKQPIWKDHNKGIKECANRKVRRALKRNLELRLPHSLYKKFFCSYDICDYRSIVSKNFEEYYQQRISSWYRYLFWHKEPLPTKEECYKDWLKYRNK